jgi:hypothetical protein
MMKIISKKQYKIAVGALVLALVLSLAMWTSYVRGEQVGGAPESGSTSYIKSLYTALQTSGYGSDTDSPDWGTYWNRLKTSAQWVPTGTATTTDVASGKTFYNSSRTQQIGVAPGSPGNCPTQQWPDNNGAATQTANCTDTVIWTTPADGIAGTEKQDPRSGLIWSNALLNSANTVTFSPTTDSQWSWDASAANNVAVGNMTAPALCSSMGNGWRLPYQKELMQAYIDGAYFNLSQPTLQYWSATEYGSNSAIYVNLSYGNSAPSYNGSKSYAYYYVRCVR